MDNNDFFKLLLGRILRNVRRQGFFRSSLFILALSVSSVILGFILEAVLARNMTTEQYGIYRYVFSWTAVLGIFATLGGNLLLLRVFPAKLAGKSYEEARGALDFSCSLCLVGSLSLCILGLLVILIRFPTWDFRFSMAALVAVASIPLIGIAWLQEAHLQALKLATWSRVASGLIRPGVRLFVVAGLLFFAPTFMDDAWEAGAGVFVSFFASLAIMTFIIRRKTPEDLKVCEARKPHESSFRLAFTLLSISLFLIILEEITTIILGFYLSMEEVAIYNTGYRVAVVAAFGLQAVGTISAPIFSEYHATRSKQEYQDVVSHLTIIMGIIGLPVVLLLMIFGKVLLGLFGPPYEAAYPCVLILCCGQLVNLATGSCGWLMLMSGKESVQFRVTLISVLLSVIALPILIPEFGKEGAAFFAASIMAGRNLVTWYIAKESLEIDSSIWRALIKRNRGS